MNVDGVIKLILIMELLAGNPTIRDTWQIDAVASQLMSRIGYLPTDSPSILILPTVQEILESNNVVIGAR